MRKRFLVGFVILLAVAALLPSIREAFQRRVIAIAAVDDLHGTHGVFDRG